MKQEAVLDWAVVGAGPAGIAAVGKLIDQGVSPEKISWIDPHFMVGDLGQKWTLVPSNTNVELFLRFLRGCKAFDFNNRPTKFPLEQLDLQETCVLQQIVEPLQWVTDHLKKKVRSLTTTVMELSLGQGLWTLTTQHEPLHATKVILAIGSEPRLLPFAGPTLIGLDTALHPEKLRKTVGPQDTVAVFGSSHSAILVLANLMESKVKKVVNFYRSPHRYAIAFDDWILFDDTGLKGFSARWAKKHIDGTLPHTLQRVLLTDPSFEESLALCNKVIYAVGFERRKLPILEQYGRLGYDDRTGIIAPGLFGLGIAFPQAQFNRLGQLDLRVGLWKFMDYLNTILPLWLQYSN